MSRLRIQQLQWIGAIAVIMVCLMMAGSTIAFSLSDYLNYKRGVAEFNRFHVALHAAAAISRERGPANSLMGAPEEQQPQFIAALRNSRQETDRDIASIETHFRTEIDGSAEMRNAFIALKSQLQTGRSAVDAVAATPYHERSGARIAEAIRAMFRAADRAQDYRDIAGRSIIALAPETSAEVILTSLAGTLRERAGRVGSYVVMMATSQGDARRNYREAFDGELNRLQEVNAILKTYTPIALQSPAIALLLDRVTVNYFSGSLLYAQRVAFELNNGNPPSPAEFSEKYVPGLTSTEKLREEIENSALSSLEAMRRKAFNTMLVSILLAGTAISVMLGLVYVLGRSIFRPMLAAIRQIDDIAAGNLLQPPPMRHAGREAREMFQRLDLLREQQRLKRHLEMERKSMTEELRRLSQTDALTGLLNRRALGEAMGELLTAPRANLDGVAVIMFDIDHFKQINDRHGHGLGDLVLQRTAQILSPYLREQDLFARYGGEEFLIVLVDVTESFAHATAQRLCDTLSQAVISDEHKLTATASFGVDWRSQHAIEHWEELAAVADRRLYQAKRNGRNMVCFSDMPEDKAVISIAKTKPGGAGVA
ncbi:GGDEF domain-containing protein [Rhizobium lusitanum]|uniref:diguanylate cyclase n=1 Tax=Rhizobium lusitanum TaxID=293958 RepID=A0A7X0MEE7_9HYPH|nr:GGDEF domain-containing protein [Rhizobium lusitanum]MBB6487882.1 diguanylate cyclase (GGDEF)-like protein [Rhizobium lusitanum]